MIVSIARSSPLRAAAITASSPVSRQTRGCTWRATAAFDLATLHLRPKTENDEDSIHLKLNVKYNLRFESIASRSAMSSAAAAAKLFEHRPHLRVERIGQLVPLAGGGAAHLSGRRRGQPVDVLARA